jgi:hypothetical protein
VTRTAHDKLATEGFECGWNGLSILGELGFILGVSAAITNAFMIAPLIGSNANVEQLTLT